MQKKFLYLTIGAVLIAPSLAVATHNEITPADMRTTPAPTTLQSKVEGPSGELLATQPGEVELDSDTSNRVQPLNMQHSAANYQPLIKGEVNSGNVTPADMRTTPAPVTLKEKKQDPRGELLATQPGEIEFNESRRITVR